MRKILILLLTPTLLFATPFKDGTLHEKLAYIDLLVEKGEATSTTRANLVHALEDKDAPLLLQERSAWALGQLELRKGVEALVKASEHKSLLVRRAALKSLIRMRARTGLERYMQMAQHDPVLSIRQEATIALGIIRWNKSINTLVILSDDPVPEIRGAAVLGMGATHSSTNDFREVLKEMTKDESPYVASRAELALEVCDKNKASIKRQLIHSDPDIRLFAAVFYHFNGSENDLAFLEQRENIEANDEVHYELGLAIKKINKDIKKATRASSPNASVGDPQ